MRLLLDTCALIWWTVDQARLPAATLASLNDSELLISSISVWEVGVKIKRQHLDIGMNLQTYAKKLHMLSNLQIIPVSDEIWVKNLELDWEHKDPADRTIVATASMEQCAIVTTDRCIKSYYQNIFWQV